VAGCNDDIKRVGFPMTVREWGGEAYRSTFDATALHVDVVVALMIGLAAAARSLRPRGVT
jgi:hypothetical protein